MTIGTGPWRIEKRGYSRDPWRVVDADGNELTTMKPDWREGFPPYPAPMAYPTKTAAVEGLGAIAARLYARLAAITDEIDR